MKKLLFLLVLIPSLLFGQITIENSNNNIKFIESGSTIASASKSQLSFKINGAMVQFYWGGSSIYKARYSEIDAPSTANISDLADTLNVWIGANIITNVPLSSSGNIEIEIQDQHSDRISLFLGQTLGVIDSISLAVKDADSIHISTSVLPVVGNFICLQEDGKITQEEILSVNLIGGTDYAITIRAPLDYSYTTAVTGHTQNVDMDVVGTLASPIIFQIAPAGTYKWDITRMIVSMVLGTAGDDGLFGNLTALTNGQYFRKEDDGNSQNLFFAIDNSDFRTEGFDIAYPVRSGGLGSYGFGARISFNGADKSGVVIRLDGANGDSFTAPVRDDLTGISKYRIKIQGHVVID